MTSMTLMSSIPSRPKIFSISSIFSMCLVENIKNVLVKNNYNIDKLPNKLLNYEIGKILFNYMFTLEKLYEILIIDEEICKLAVCNNGNNLKFVPKNIINKEICKLSCMKNGLSIKFVPKNIINEEICKYAVQNIGNTLEYVPKNMINKEICKLAVQQNGLSIKFVPLNIINKEICKLAVIQNGWALEYILNIINKKLIHKDLLDEEICKLAVENNPYSINAIKEDIILLTDISIYLVSQNGKMIKYFKYKNKDIIVCAVKNKGIALKYLTRSEITLDICKLAIKQTKDALIYVPNEFRVLLKSEL
jgi:hypothetical protein